MTRADTPTTVASVRVDTSARPGIEAHSVRPGHRHVKPRTGRPPIRGLRVECRRGRSLGCPKRARAVHRVHHATQRRGHDRGVDSHAPNDLTIDVGLDQIAPYVFKLLDLGQATQITPGEGVGGQLTPLGALKAAGAINEKRETVRQLQVVLDKPRAG